LSKRKIKKTPSWCRNLDTKMKKGYGSVNVKSMNSHILRFVFRCNSIGSTNGQKYRVVSLLEAD
jgi:hypothetical protein